ncbi:MAG: hypothetical protein JWR14_629 [Caballeronia sp.]|jgi:hypothetical protein|nr:hypothetical protein [Caballeronia sp.]
MRNEFISDGAWDSAWAGTSVFRLLANFVTAVVTACCMAAFVRFMYALFMYAPVSG